MKKKKYAPRLYNKKVRLSATLHLPPEMKDGIKKIARSENESMSWVIEELLNDVMNFGIHYVNPSNKRSK